MANYLKEAANIRLVIYYLSAQFFISICLVLVPSAEKFKFADRLEIVGIFYFLISLIALLVFVSTGFVSRNINYVRIVTFNLLCIFSLFLYSFVSVEIAQPAILILNGSSSPSEYTVLQSTPEEEVIYVTDLLFFADFVSHWMRNTSFWVSLVFGNIFLLRKG